MTTTQTLDLTTFADKKVNITFRPDGTGEATTKEGLIQAASAIGVIFKEKGKADVHIIEPDWIDSLEEQPEKEPNVSVKKLQPVTKNFRQHLADRHGYLPADLNNITEAQAEEIHKGIDHSPLAHYHEAPQAQQDAQASTPVSDDPLGEDGGAEPEADEPAA